MANPQIYRHPNHDYRSRCSYMITLSKHKSVPDFGDVIRSPFTNNRFYGGVAVAYSHLGKAVKDSLRLLSEYDRAITLQQYVVMPDHIHLLIRVNGYMARTIGEYVAVWKANAKRFFGKPVFEQGFNDQILYAWRSLNAVYEYIRQNPYRLLIRRERPDYFRRFNNLTLGNAQMQAYGNIDLLGNPFKEAVILHRADINTSEYERKRHLWLYSASNRGVLVSPFISPHEKRIRDEAEALGGRFIILSNKPLREREKPSGRLFDLCTQGRCLLLAPQEPMALNRAGCLRLNSLAALLAGNPTIS